MAQNLGTIFTAVRATGYEGRLVAVTYYAQNYEDVTEVRLIEAVDDVLAAVSHEFDGKRPTVSARFETSLDNSTETRVQLVC